jgi:hypothetical protein
MLTAGLSSVYSAATAGKYLELLNNWFRLELDILRVKTGANKKITEISSTKPDYFRISNYKPQKDPLSPS